MVMLGSQLTGQLPFKQVGVEVEVEAGLEVEVW